VLVPPSSSHQSYQGIDNNWDMFSKLKGVGHGLPQGVLIKQTGDVGVDSFNV
jgi:hypothetical protein